MKLCQVAGGSWLVATLSLTTATNSPESHKACRGLYERIFHQWTQSAVRKENNTSSEIVRSLMMCCFRSHPLCTKTIRIQPEMQQSGQSVTHTTRFHNSFFPTTVRLMAKNKISKIHTKSNVSSMIYISICNPHFSVQ